MNATLSSGMSLEQHCDATQGALHPKIHSTSVLGLRGCHVAPYHPQLLSFSIFQSKPY